MATLAAYPSMMQRDLAAYVAHRIYEATAARG